VPLSTMFNSVNPDYLDTGDFYKRDEWEIDRAKIVLGKYYSQLVRILSSFTNRKNCTVKSLR